MTSIGILSDIHSNLEALQAVLADAAEAGVNRFICLGDTIGYGPNPIECLDIAKNFEMHLAGNHEVAIMEGSHNFAAEAEQAIEWTNKKLQIRPDLRRFIRARPHKIKKDDSILVHGSPSSPIWMYLAPNSYISDVMDQFRYFMDLPICLCGHTHLPGIFIYEDDHMQYYCPEEVLYHYTLIPGQKYILNPGSVGQPRDGNKRASYMIRNGDKIFWRRVKYQVDKTVAKIFSIPELPNKLGQRLLIGA
jgi:diadenosine tetraphosphatase ApaH/serine/threonine PP2A family protein phosphatase